MQSSGTERSMLRMDGLLLPREDQLESAARLTQHDINEKAERSVRARRCKTGYISLIFTAWGGSMISPAPPEDSDFIDIKKKLP
jgi:hypothetical protein